MLKLLGFIYLFVKIFINKTTAAAQLSPNVHMKHSTISPALCSSLYCLKTKTLICEGNTKHRVYI